MSVKACSSQRRDAFKINACQLQGVTLYKLTSFDLTQRKFEPFIRSLMTESQWRSIAPPTKLYATAEKLTSMKVVKKRYRKPGFWSLLKRTYLRLIG